MTIRLPVLTAVVVNRSLIFGGYGQCPGDGAGATRDVKLTSVWLNRAIQASASRLTCIFCFLRQIHDNKFGGCTTDSFARFSGVKVGDDCNTVRRDGSTRASRRWSVGLAALVSGGTFCRVICSARFAASENGVYKEETRH